MLKIGVILERAECAAWLADAIQAAMDVACFTAFILNRTSTQQHTAASHLLKIALSMDNKRTATGPQLMNPTSDLAALMTFARTSGLPLADDLAHRGIDLLVIACDVPDAAVDMIAAHLPYGAWRFITEGENAALHPCPGAKSLAQADPVLTMDIVASKASQKFLVGRAETRSHDSSISINARRTLCPTRNLLRDALIKLTRNRSDGLAAFPAVDQAALASPLTFRQSGLLIANALVRTARNQLLPRTKQQWSIGVCKNDESNTKTAAMSQIIWADPNPTSFLADPFLIERYGVRYVFVEEFPYRAQKGHISVLELDERNNFSRPIKVLECEEHLSFPFVFEQDGRFFMIPERRTSDTILLYEATRFPYEWEPCRVLVSNFPGVDTILHRQGDRLWLFTTYGANENQDNNLHIFSAPSLFDEFKPHRKNPVKTDIRSSRMAGKLFERSGRLYRPAQNCSLRYGGSIVINEIDDLNDDVFHEHLVEEILPDRQSMFPLGLHTRNMGTDAIVIDGLRNIPARSRQH